MSDTVSNTVSDTIAMIDHDERVVMFDDGRSLPITHYFDAFGDDCEPDDAVSCVAGAEGKGWYTIDLRCYIPASIH